MTVSTDVLIIGSGIAGLCTAIHIAKQKPKLKITIVTKAEKNESNTKYAQGGIAVVKAKTDTYKNHIEDTLKAGDYLNDREIVEKVVEAAPERINEIINWGVSFDKNQKGKFILNKEGGHSNSRIIHHKDFTGFEILRALLFKTKEYKNISLLQHHFVVELITNHQLQIKKTQANACYGAYILNQKTNQVESFKASAICIATGGIGQVYKYTTNPTIATGDGIAMAYRAKAEIKNMEFIQFHPTALYEPGKSPSFLISEAVRGAGAILLGNTKERFMLKYDARGELASRDIVSRVIDNQLKKTGSPCVYLDASSIKKFKALFPTIYNQCLSIGINPEKELIPVVPAMHYVCGGISTNKQGKTTLKNLYACGESSCTGLHGSNRLASNSLLEAIVFAYEVANTIVNNPLENFSEDIPQWNEKGTITPSEKILIRQNKEEIQTLMSNYVAIVRSNERLEQALKRINTIYKETENFYRYSKLSTSLGELRNLVTISYIIVQQSLKRKENKGTFYNINLS